MATGVLVDANVLFSRTLRDWLFLLRNRSRGELFTVRCSVDILAEVLYRLRRQFPNAPGTLTRTVHDRILEQVDDLLDDFDVASSNYPGLDNHDAHVHAAAIASESKILLTADAGFLDLPDTTLAALPYEAHSPDSFFLLIDDSAPHVVCDVVADQLDYFILRKGEADLPAQLRKAGCPEFARRVRDHIRRLP